MKQRISVRIRVISGEKLLLIRRRDGRRAIIGKYELPGGRVLATEQPEDAAWRRLAQDVGLEVADGLALEDVFTYDDADDRGIQYAVIVFRLPIDSSQTVKLSSHYDKYSWRREAEAIDPSNLTDVSQMIIGTAGPVHVSRESGSRDKLQSSSSKVLVYTDGGSRGNPGPSAAGYVIIENGEVVDQGGEYLGITTNNQAEYHGARIGLEAAKRLGYEEVELRVDSMLVVNQLKGVYKIKNRDLWPINERVNQAISQLKSVRFQHVPREMNRLADSMVNQTLDHHK